MTFSYLCGIMLSLCVASAVGQGGSLSNLIVPQPNQQQTVQLAHPVTSGQVTPLVNLPTSGQILNQVSNYPPQLISAPFGSQQQSGQLLQNTWQQPQTQQFQPQQTQQFQPQQTQQFQPQQTQQLQQPSTMQNLQTMGQQQQANVAVPPVLGGPLANLAMANRLSNALTPQQQKGMNPLGLYALGAGGSDALFPYMLLSGSGMLNQNPMLSLMVLSNY